MEKDIYKRNEIIKIMVTGNGFDIAHLLPTSYKDFIDIMNMIINMDNNQINTEIKKLISKNEKFKDLYDLDELNFENLKRDFSEFSKQLEFSIKDKKATGLELYEYFRKINIKNKWIDFEKEINDIIRTMINFNEMLLDNHIGYICDTGRVNFNTSLNHKVTPKWKKEFEVNYQKLYDFKIIFDNEKIREEYIENEEIQIEYIIEILYKTIEKFECLFSWYLENVVSNILNHKKDIDANKDLQETDYYITFNYTDTFGKLYYGKKALDEKYFIHGSVENKNIVLGCNYLNDDEESDHSRIFKKVFKRIHYNTDFIAVQKIKNNIDEAIDVENKKIYYGVEEEEIKKIEIIFWGHSLDKTDSDIIIELINYIEIYKKQNVFVEIKVFYHNMTSKFDLLNNLFILLGKEKVEKYTNLGNIIFEEKNLY